MLNDIFIALLGMVVVFAVLILLQYIIEAIRVFSNKRPKKDVKPDPAVGVEPIAAAPISAPEIDPADDEELAAVIAAAIAASLNVSTYDLNIKSIRRVPPYAPVWNRVGRQQQVMTRL